MGIVTAKPSIRDWIDGVQTGLMVEALLKAGIDLSDPAAARAALRAANFKEASVDRLAGKAIAEAERQGATSH